MFESIKQICLQKRTYFVILWTGILLIAFWIRIQGIGNIPDGQFSETDAYFYYWQASLISERGQLPARDMNRWLPLGRDLGQTLNLYGYVLAYTHKAISLVFANITLYHVCLYTPVVCFCIGLGVLCLYLYHVYGLMFSLTAGLILATLPGSIERSTAGFGDRDAFCLMIGILAVVTYLVSLQTEKPRKRLFWTLSSGFIVFLGGLSWEGFGVFLSVIIVIELWRFLTTETEKRLGLYALWVCCFVPTLYLASPAYRNGYGFAEHLAAFVLMPPLVLLAMRSIRSLLLSKVAKLCRYGRSLSLGLAVAFAFSAVGYVFLQQETFARTTVPLSQNRLMEITTELGAPHFKYWMDRYGSVFILGSLGATLLILSVWKFQGGLLAASLTFFSTTTFLMQPLDKLLGVSVGNVLFGVSLASCLIALLILSTERKTSTPREFTSIALIGWFLIWVGLTRNAKRYDFFIGIPLACFTTVLILFLSKSVRAYVKSYITSAWMEPCLALLMLFLVLLCPPLGGHAIRSVYAATQMRKATPSPRVAKALSWMKTQLPNTSIVAAEWSYGSQLNVLAGVKTITDQDHYIQHWIELYYQHVLNTKNEIKALEFLKTHGATHLMLVGYKPAKTFLQGQLSNAFLPIYPKENFAEAHVNIWELHYPPDIPTDVKYLKTGLREIDKDLRPE